MLTDGLRPRRDKFLRMIFERFVFRIIDLILGTLFWRFILHGSNMLQSFTCIKGLTFGLKKKQIVFK